MEAIFTWRGGGGVGAGGLENERQGREFVEGGEGIWSQNILKSRDSEMVLTTFSMRYFLPKSFQQFLYKAVAS